MGVAQKVTENKNEVNEVEVSFSIEPHQTELFLKSVENMKREINLNMINLTESHFFLFFIKTQNKVRKKRRGKYRCLCWNRTKFIHFTANSFTISLHNYI